MVAPPDTARVPPAPLCGTADEHFAACVATKPRSEECQDHWSTPPVPADQELQAMEAIAALTTMTAADAVRWVFHLQRYLGNIPSPHSADDSENRSDYQPLTASLAHQREHLSQDHTTIDEARTRLQQIVTLGAAGAIFAHEAQENFWQSGFPDESTYWGALQTISASVFADGAVDPLERIVLSAFAELGWGDYRETSGAAPLTFIRDGYRVATEQPYPLRMLINGQKIALFPNQGDRSEAPDPLCTPPPGYTVIASTDPRIANRNTHVECYTFALSTHPKYSLSSGGEDVDPEYILQTEYRPVDPTREPARIGDVVAYLSWLPDITEDDYPLWSHHPTALQDVFSSPHMGVVSAVDAHGYPTRVISKFGFGTENIYEHPIDQVATGYGHVYALFRHLNERP